MRSRCPLVPRAGCTRTKSGASSGEPRAPMSRHGARPRERTPTRSRCIRFAEGHRDRAGGASGPARSRSCGPGSSTALRTCTSGLPRRLSPGRSGAGGPPPGKRGRSTSCAPTTESAGRIPRTKAGRDLPGPGLAHPCPDEAGRSVRGTPVDAGDERLRDPWVEVTANPGLPPIRPGFVRGASGTPLHDLSIAGSMPSVRTSIRPIGSRSAGASSLRPGVVEKTAGTPSSAAPAHPGPRPSAR